MSSVCEQIAEYLETAGVCFQLFEHQPCASSEESEKARKAAGAGETVGAKALLVKNKQAVYSLCVIPGNRRLNSKKLRQLVGKHSFATAAEMGELTDGLQPGHMPPFGPQIFSGITQLIIDSSIRNFEKIGFNAGDPTVSMVMAGNDYVNACKETCTMMVISE